MTSLIRTLLLATVIAAVQTAAASPAWQPGFIVLAEDRFDPAIQRLIAEHSLRSLPLDRGRLYYLYPMWADPRLEEMQIRYLEMLLDKRAAKEAETASSTEPDSPSP